MEHTDSSPELTEEGYTKTFVFFIIAIAIILLSYMSYSNWSIGVELKETKRQEQDAKASLQATAKSEAMEMFTIVENIRKDKAELTSIEVRMKTDAERKEKLNISIMTENEKLMKHGVAATSRVSQ